MHVTVVVRGSYYFCFNDTSTTEIYTLSLHDALPICVPVDQVVVLGVEVEAHQRATLLQPDLADVAHAHARHANRLTLRSEEHTSELQSRQYLVCSLLLEKKKRHRTRYN